MPKINAIRLIDKTKITKEQWLEVRRGGIGGSDISGILGRNPWMSALDVYLEKLEEIAPVETTEQMRWGNILEGVIATEYAERTGRKIERVNAILQHPKIAWALANIDRLIKEEDQGILEIKTSDKFNRSWDSGIPEHYLLQVQWYMFVTGLDYAYFATLRGGNELITPDIVKRDDELIDMMLNLATGFWERVKNRIPPEPDGSKAATEIMKKLYPSAKKSVSILLPEDSLTLIEQYDYAAREEEKWQDVKEGAKNKLKALLGEAERGEVGQFLVSWKNTAGLDIERLTKEKPEIIKAYPKGLDTTKLKKMEPEIYQAYLNPSVSRRFDISEKGEEKPNGK